MKSDYIWINGELVSYKDANVHILSPTLHYGLGVFEGIRCYDTVKGPAIFRLKDHVKRLIDSVHILGILDFPYTHAELCGAIHETIRANRFSSCYIRPLVYMADGPLGLNLDTSQTAVSIATWEWGTFLGEEALDKGAKAIVSSFTRLHPNVTMTKAKITGNYVNSVLAKTIAVRSGFDEAIMLDTEGYVAECTGENLFLVRNGKIYTPPRAAILEGITRDSVIKLAKDLGFEVIEEQITRDQLYMADEVFVCGTAAEVVALREIDYRSIGLGNMGPVTKKLQQSFFETAQGTGPRSDEWLEHVSYAEASIGI
ncbi:MAG: branched-chain amino acid transaminase [Chloroflexi bacterium]|nr:branched-chain amino acid transaminase [Chloroflexota bacterium]